jgi:hypothetical protein
MAVQNTLQKKREIHRNHRSPRIRRQYRIHLRKRRKYTETKKAGQRRYRNRSSRRRKYTETVDPYEEGQYKKQSRRRGK